MDNKGNGPWLVALLKHTVRKMYTVYCHTYAHQHAAILNGIHGNKQWKTIAVVGPFDILDKALLFTNEWKQLDPTIESCIELCKEYHVGVWNIVQAPKPEKKARLTLDILDDKLTIKLVRLIRAKG